MKRTKKDYFNILIQIVKTTCTPDELKQELLDFIQHEIDLNNKRSSGKRPTAKQIENENLKLKMKNALIALGKPVTATEMANADEILAELSNQRVSALLNQLVDTGEVIKTTIKRRSYFSIAEVGALDCGESVR